MPGRQLRLGLPALALAALFPVLVARAQPQGELTYAMHVTITPSWFDPAENTGIATPFMVQEALHDALVKPMPQNPMAPSLAESWTESADGQGGSNRPVYLTTLPTDWLPNVEPFRDRLDRGAAHVIDVIYDIVKIQNDLWREVT